MWKEFFKDKVELQGVISVISIITGALLLIAGFICPPVAVIDHSVLIAFGEIATFVGACLGIDYKYKVYKDGKK